MASDATASTERPEHLVPNWFLRLGSMRDVTIVVSAVTVLFVIFGMIYSRYYFNRLGFPYQFMDLGTSFFMLRSLTPLGLSLCFAIIVSGAVLLTPLTDLLLTRWQSVTIFHILIPILLPIAITGVIGWGFLRLAGYEYLLQIDGESTTRLSIAVIVGYFAVAVGVGGYSFLGDADTIRGKRWALIALIAGIVIALLSSAYAGVLTGRIEAIALIQGESRNSIIVEFSPENGSIVPAHDLVLVMILDGKHYVTPMMKSAAEHPKVYVLSDDEITNVRYIHLAE